MIELNLSEIAVVVVSLATSSAVAFAAWLVKRHLARIERSLDTIAQHTTKLAVIETKLAAIEARLNQTESDTREIKAGVCQLRRDYGAPASRS